ncbi:MAG: hypothetical protein ACJ74Y_05615 [Bryobacteraceae bacterium]
MPLSLPRLDDRTWEDLVEESRRRIPVYAPHWTNHNPSDPGMTLIELFAYFCESFLYRTDQVGERHKLAFLRLINGPEWRPTPNLAEDVRNTMQDLSRPHRAVTPSDFEDLALRSPGHREAEFAVQVGRAKCLVRTDLSSAGARSRSDDAPGHVSLLIVPKPFEAKIDPLLRHVRSLVEKARLIGTRVHVVPARYLSLSVRLSITADHRFSTAGVKTALITALTNFFDPLNGGEEGTGWPFGRSVFVSELYQLLVAVPGIIAIHRARDPETGAALDELLLVSPDASRIRRNRFGELDAIELRASELVTYVPGNDEIMITQELRRREGRRDGAPSIN